MPCYDVETGDDAAAFPRFAAGGLALRHRRTIDLTEPVAFTFANPVEVRFGRGRVAEVVDLLEGPTLVVTTPGTLRRFGDGDVLEGRPGVHAYAEVPPNPGASVVDAGTRHAARWGVETVLGLGGGSAMDAAKCIALVVGNDADLPALRRRVAHGEPVRRRVKLIQVPTTAGTGAEVTRWASMWEGGRKWSFEHPACYADVTIVDPRLCDSMGARLTAATGLDAFAHAVESIWSARATPLSDIFATAALDLIGARLLEAVAQATPCARDSMSLAALAAGLALSQTKSAAAHALSYPLTGHYALEHGLAVGLMCRALLPAHAHGCPDRVDLILAALGASSVEGAEAFIDRVFQCAGLEPSLRPLRLSAEDLRSIAVAAAGADRIANSRIPLDVDRLVRALEPFA